jgi:hypothetical protein
VRGFREPKRTQRFLTSFGPIRQHFAIKRHLLRASLYREPLLSRSHLIPARLTKLFATHQTVRRGEGFRQVRFRS